ncbi:Hypothetical predicted protein [Olea europaea subsp. europaea]|uniref:Uncharacterized protein n=1 Tax=Olea europaea subsp. europaea TaxID=158383 RepID=A0A8S0RQP1_OLEEU|nr:Hypothetical predicted protein [Olea europaea subsp. europaea]
MMDKQGHEALDGVPCGPETLSNRGPSPCSLYGLHLHAIKSLGFILSFLKHHHILFHHQLSSNTGFRQDPKDNYIEKRFREDSSGAALPTASKLGRTGVQDQEPGSEPKFGLAQPSNFLPAPAMWAMAPVASNVGNAFWMLPVTAGATTSTLVPGHQEHQLWQYKAPSIQRIGGFEFPSCCRFIQVQLGSMVLQQPQPPVQQLGLGVSDTSNMGTLASVPTLVTWEHWPPLMHIAIVLVGLI